MQELSLLIEECRTGKQLGRLSEKELAVGGSVAQALETMASELLVLARESEAAEAALSRGEATHSLLLLVYPG